MLQAASGTHGGMMNLGPRPTFNDSTLSLEVHLFDVRGDWYGLRFLAGRAGGEQACAAWDRRGRQLLVPVERRWPLLYEQILVQASGLLPGRSPAWLCYHGISQELAECLCGKLDVELEVAASPVSPDCQRAAV